jgi:hypothetical protein
MKQIISSYCVCRDECYQIYQLYGLFQHVTGTRRIHLDPETDPSLCPFSSIA